VSPLCGVLNDVTATVTPAAATTLTTADRCDRCGAQARVRVVLASGDLTFCAHHAKAYEPSLRPDAREWIDQTASLEV
jgi:hypothetical protein